MPSKITISTHSSSKISQVIMTANACLFRCKVLIIACLAHSFAIVNSRLMRAAVYLFSTPGSSSWLYLSLFGIERLLCIQSELCRSGRDFVGLVSSPCLLKVLIYNLLLILTLNHIRSLFLSYIVWNSIAIDFEVEAGLDIIFKLATVSIFYRLIITFSPHFNLPYIAKY